MFTAPKKLSLHNICVPNLIKIIFSSTTDVLKINLKERRRGRRTNEKNNLYIIVAAFFLCSTTTASALSFYDSAKSDLRKDYIDTNSNEPDTNFTYYLNLPNWYNSTLVTKFDLTLSGWGDNSDEDIDFYVSLDDKSSWTLVGSYDAPNFTNFTKTLDILGFKNLFDGYDHFYVAYGCHFYHDMTEVIIEQNPVPEPASLLLLGTGIIGLGSVGRKKVLKKIVR